jgi:outer membrane protein TolC
VLQLLKMQDQKQHELIQAEKELEFWVGKKVSSNDLVIELPDDEKIVVPEGEKNHLDLELKLAQNQWSFSKLDAELAKKEKRPDLFFGAGYRVENVVPQNNFSYAILGLNIPIWDTGSFREESTRAREKRDQRYFEEAQRRVSLKHQKQQEFVLFYIGQIKRFPKKLLREQENYIHMAEAGFKQGVVDVNTFLLSETQTHDVIDQIFISWMGYLDNLSALQLMRGERFVWEK